MIDKNFIKFYNVSLYEYGLGPKTWANQEFRNSHYPYLTFLPNLIYCMHQPWHDLAHFVCVCIITCVCRWYLLKIRTTIITFRQVILSFVTSMARANLYCVYLILICIVRRRWHGKVKFSYFPFEIKNSVSCWSTERYRYCRSAERLNVNFWNALVRSIHV